MWTTLTLIAALHSALGQADQLQLTHVRTPYSLFGVERKDNKLLPGDVFIVMFNIEGLKEDKNGKFLFQMGMKMTDAKGKLKYGEEPEGREAISLFGGRSVPSFAHAIVGPGTDAGEYTLTVTVTDRTTNASQKLTRKFEVLEPRFGMVRIATTVDAAGNIFTPAIGVVGETRWLHCNLVGFERDKVKKQPNILIEMQILDENDKPTLAKPLTDERSSVVPADAAVVPIDVALPLNRAGKFTVKLQATDRIAKKKAEFSLPLQVMEQPPSTASGSK
jgi:hypothetical protein